MELEGIRTAGITAVPGNYREFRFLRGVREVIRFLGVVAIEDQFAVGWGWPAELL